MLRLENGSIIAAEADRPVTMYWQGQEYVLETLRPLLLD
jgi:hypothetical protein